MSKVDVAHIRQQGVDLIIVPLDRQFGHKSNADQHEVVRHLQFVARSAGLAGTVVPVWDHGGGRMAFLAPANWRRFFQSISLPWVWANVNRELSW